MSEPIDIESLDPLYRDVFRDPANGTPDDISKAGCLALAFRGKNAWNHWRKLFPVNQKRDGFKTNRAVFSGCDLTNHLLDFSEFNFGTDADFSEATLPITANFRDCKFQGYTSFKDSVFPLGVNFADAEFAGGVGFQRCAIQSLASFYRTRFSSGVSFEGAAFGNKTNFSNTIFNYDVSFEGAIFYSDVVFEYQGDDKVAERFPRINFSGCDFLKIVRFVNIKFKGHTNFGDLAIDAPILIRRRARFANGIWGLQTLNWNKKTSFLYVPEFHGCELHSDTTFNAVIFPNPVGSDGAVRAYRALKLAFSKQQAIREEQMFFRLEMAEESIRAVGVQRLFYKIYAICSDFGFSVWLPIKHLIFFPALFFALAYQFLMAASPPFLWHEGLIQRPELLWQWVQFTLSNITPVPGIDLAKELRIKLFGQYSVASSIGLVFEMLQKILALAAYFLSGLALRNLFKLK